MNECDKCVQDDPYCKSYEHNLEERITFLEEELDRLTMIVAEITRYIAKEMKDDFN